MKKGLIISMIILVTFLFNNKVSAKEVYYTNDNGVSLSLKEYELVQQLYGDSYVDEIDSTLYDTVINNLNPEDNDIDVTSYDDYNNNSLFNFGISTRSSMLETPKKRLSIGKSCGTAICFVVITNTWLASPSVRSYDLIGARLANGSFADSTSYTTTLTYNGNSSSISNYKYASNGVGCSVKIPTGVLSTLAISQTFYTNVGGTIYGSYQHAIGAITLNQSKNYTFSSGGYGSVFLVSGYAANKYDEMSGVSTTLS